MERLLKVSVSLSIIPLWIYGSFSFNVKAIKSVFTSQAKRRDWVIMWEEEKSREDKKEREKIRVLANKGRASASISWCLIYHPFHRWIWCHYSLHINQEMKLRAQLTLLPITPTLCRHKTTSWSPWEAIMWL